MKAFVTPLFQRAPVSEASCAPASSSVRSHDGAAGFKSCSLTEADLEMQLMQMRDEHRALIEDSKHKALSNSHRDDLTELEMKVLRSTSFVVIWDRRAS